jgi:isochorismate synthase
MKRSPWSSRQLGAAFDLLALGAGAFVFERDGLGVAGLGGAVVGGPVLRDVAHTTITVLRGHVTEHPAAPPFVVAAIPFDPGAMCELHFPERGVRRTRPGETWSFDIATDGSPLSFRSSPVISGAPADRFTEIQLIERPTPGGYREAVAGAITRIRAGELSKVVIARTIEVHAGRTLDPRALAHRLRAVDPDAYTFTAPTGDGAIVGASPELLVSRFGREVRSNPLAGSAPRSGDAGEDRANADALAASTKDREEHAIVVEAVAETLRPLCEELAWDPEPVLRETPNVWHLSTRFRGVLRDPPPTALDLVAALHPTPAVAGTPTDAALATIAALEPFERGAYAGPVGWMDANGDGEWAIALRCAELRGDLAVLYAGAGIVADSDPAKELDETERKFRAFLDALRWG